MKWYVQKLDDGAWSEPQLNVSFDAMNAADVNTAGWYELEPSPAPTVGLDTTLTKTLVLDGNVVKYVWEQIKKTGEELQQARKVQWRIVREERNKLLTACDYLMMPDYPTSETTKAAWATYRQALRDVTVQTDPFAISWPVDPNGISPNFGVIRV